MEKQRLISSYSKPIKQAINLIAFNPEKLVYYGSSSKKSMYLSNADIDLLEPIKEEDIINLSKQFIIILDNIKKSKLCYIADIKSGIDFYYFIDIGYIKDNKIMDFNKENIINTIKSKDFKNKTELLELLNKNISLKNWFNLEDLLRESYILRWNYDEIKQNYKLIRDNKIYFHDTIKEANAMTKLDTIQYITTENRFIEITNYFKLSNHDEEHEIESFTNSLKSNLYKYYFKKDYFKFCKRFISYLSIKKRDSTQLFNIINSNLGILYQVISDIKTIIYLFEHFNTKELDVKLIAQQIDNFKQRLGNIYEFNFNELQIDDFIDYILKLTSKMAIIKQLNILYLNLYKILNNKTKTRLIKLKIIPLKL